MAMQRRKKVMMLSHSHVFLSVFSRVALIALAASAAGAAETPPKQALGTVIGIDLGMTYSCVGVFKNGHVEIIANDQGNRITSLWVALTDTERLIGEAAKNQAAQKGDRTIFDIKSLIGRRL